MKKIFAGALLPVLVCSLFAVSVAAAGEVPLERRSLPAGDGWGSADEGVSGGAEARSGNVYTVSTRKEFVDALKRGGNSAKIIRVQGTINLSSDDSGRELTEKDYADPAYDFEAYKKTYDPNVWNRQPLVKGKPPRVSGPLEEARMRSWNNQKRVVQVLIPSNTTLIGIGDDAKIIKGNLYLNQGTSNIIIRNIAFEDAFDYFPSWNAADSYSAVPREIPGHNVTGCQAEFVDDTHGPHRCNGGRWNGEFDLISIKGATQVWIDHCSFSDGERFDKMFPPPYALPYDQPEQKVAHHDGLLDITNGSNYITVSNNHFFNHDKMNLAGGSDNQSSDEGTLKITYHHNFYENIRQRQPLTRYGQVHSYNNLFVGDVAEPHYPFAYAYGLGAAAKLYTDNDVFEIKGADSAALLVNVFVKGAALQANGATLNGKPVDIVQRFNATSPKIAINPAVGWTPQAPADLLPAPEVSAHVRANAGPGKL